MLLYVYLDYCSTLTKFAATKWWDDLSRRRVPGPPSFPEHFAEESPHRTGHPSAESAAGSNLWQAVTENKRPQGQG